MSAARVRFALHLDLVLQFVPPMLESTPGIRLTRELALPFPPYNGLVVYSRAIDDCPDPTGMWLKEVVFDLDRHVFLAEAWMVQHDQPLHEIPGEIRAWMDRGWKLGSFKDAYVDNDEHEDGDTSLQHAPSLSASDKASTLGEGWDDAERLAAMAKSRRPRAYNQCMRGMIRHMVQHYSTEDIAYAMDATGFCFDDGPEDLNPLDARDKKALLSWRQARRTFLDMPDAEKDRWRAKVLKYPTLAGLARRA